jgi:TolA-binding protein
MKSNRWIFIACAAVLLAAIALGSGALWNKREADRLGVEKQAMQQVHSDLEKSRAELANSVTKAEEKTQELNDAVAKSQQYQEEQRARATREQEEHRVQAARTVGLANAMIAAAAFKPAVAEFYQTEGKWPTANQDIGMPKPTSFAAQGVHSVSVLPGGKIQLELDDRGKRAMVK